eukprot:6094347-Alexandrium_andersonii.AAC.1
MGCPGVGSPPIAGTCALAGTRGQVVEKVPSLGPQTPTEAGAEPDREATNNSNSHAAPAWS